MFTNLMIHYLNIQHHWLNVSMDICMLQSKLWWFFINANFEINNYASINFQYMEKVSSTHSLAHRLILHINEIPIPLSIRWYENTNASAKNDKVRCALCAPRSCSYAPKALISAADVASGNSVMGRWFKDAIK